MLRDCHGVPTIYLNAICDVCAMGDAGVFKNERYFSAWLGLMPYQHSTGGHATLRHIADKIGFVSSVRQLWQDWLQFQTSAIISVKMQVIGQKQFMQIDNVAKQHIGLYNRMTRET